MRLVYLHQYFRTPAMEGGTRSYEFARRLVERGHEVHVVTAEPDATGADEPPWRTSVEAGAIVHWASVPYNNFMSYRQRMRSFGHFARVAARRAAAIDQDVVFATSTPLTIALPAAYSAWRRRVPMVLEVRDVWPEVPIALGILRSPVSRRSALALERWAYQRSKHVIALSPDMAAGIRARFPRVPVTVIPNGADRGLFQNAEAAGRSFRSRMPWLGERPLILYAGTLGFVNDVGYVARMAAALRERNPEIRFAVVGRGADGENVRRVASDLGVLGRNLFLLEPMPKSQIAGVFNACDLALSTCRNEPALNANSANKVFDAWAAGRPVAVNHGGWLAEIIERTGAGIVLPPTDPRAGAILAADFLNDTARVAAGRAAAACLAREDFDRDRLFDEFEDVLMAAASRVRAREHA